ncbi:MAG TPA: sugar phosphate isomerase/epimerase family protein [Planctomycetota bacterium]|nr:sugar phosphate isomerase/epimerase family protein [Planctomycetota bacterium]HRR81602.1 sugar phosphate isomerase/epimerase family protein [Planctomycetota bacterium]HRT93075.1 sugar phosphate isomerase/epimerase family protein [Planctomycetota bacterium]
MKRREFVCSVVGGFAAASFARHALAEEKEMPRIRLSACDWSLGAGGPGGLEVAKRCTLDGLEVSPGGAADKLQIADPKYREQLKAKAKEIGVAISSVAMGLLNGCPLATDPRGPAWLDQCIEATADLGATNILLAFFGAGDLRKNDAELKTEAVDAVVARLKEAAPRAEKARVVLGLENYLTAKQNLAILERVGSPAVQVYYDARNSTDVGHDAPAEIRELKGKLCQIHFKDGANYLGEGKVNWEAVRDALNDIGYRGWAVLETSCPSKDRDADFRRNAAFVRKLFA